MTDLRKIAEEIVNSTFNVAPKRQAMLFSVEVEYVESTLRKVENEALERAADMAERHVEFIRGVQQQGLIRERTKVQIAQAIRAMKKGE